MKTYLPVLSASINRKGVLDIDTVKGCFYGMKKYPNGGCYGLCYAAKVSKFYGYDFTQNVSRLILKGKETQRQSLFGGVLVDGWGSVESMVKNHHLKWFRIGTMGDPCHDWGLTVLVCGLLYHYKIPVIITKHWVKIPAEVLEEFLRFRVVVNTSVSALDSESEIIHRVAQFERIKRAGVRSVLRIVSCKFGDTENGNRLALIQEKLFKMNPVVDNPLRVNPTNNRVTSGDIVVEKIMDLNKENYISRLNKDTFIGKCTECPDQCGVL